jgi:hypothetical protein
MFAWGLPSVVAALGGEVPSGDANTQAAPDVEAIGTQEEGTQSDSGPRSSPRKRQRALSLAILPRSNPHSSPRSPVKRAQMAWAQMVGVETASLAEMEPINPNELERSKTEVAAPRRNKFTTWRPSIPNMLPNIPYIVKRGRRSLSRPKASTDFPSSEDKKRRKRRSSSIDSPRTFSVSSSAWGAAASAANTGRSLAAKARAFKSPLTRKMKGPLSPKLDNLSLSDETLCVLQEGDLQCSVPPRVVCVALFQTVLSERHLRDQAGGVKDPSLLFREALVHPTHSITQY